MRKGLIGIGIALAVIIGVLVFLEQKAVNANPPGKEVVIEIKNVLDQ
ncbi:hypothetical protein MNBD_ALPHA06-1398 [hydrothermal vent metagenome]|uniref:Uncharacterized protein n=1 Tax=hydrothermal vent metagenome TaxID=652676 RepID=A0A3B0R6Y4_9ZZZZ